MSKAHLAIKLLTFGALSAAAYSQAGSDPEGANRLTTMLTSLLGTLSGEIGGGILDRALFDKGAMRPIKTWVAYLADQRWNPSSRFYIAGETLRDFQLAKR